MDTVLVSGANRGIGLELARQYLNRGFRVLGCYRSVGAASALTAITHDIDVYQLDVGDPASIQHLTQKLQHVKIDILIYNDAWHEAFVANTIGPHLLTTALRENLTYSNHARVVTLSSQMGVMTRPGKESDADRSSKAAVYKVMQLLAEDCRGQNIITCAVHPGWVKTDMSGDNADLTVEGITIEGITVEGITVEESAAGIISVVDKLTMADAGKFFTWTGEELGW